MGYCVSYFSAPADSYIEIQQGNVDGRSMVFAGGSSSLIEVANYRDITPLSTLAGASVFPTASESWEVLSTDVNDTAGGSGARSIVVSSLNDGYVQQAPIVVALNGTTPVAISGTHFRLVGSVLTEAGALFTNAGNITIRVAGGGASRGLILADIGTAQTGTYTVPAGKVAYLQDFLITTPKNNDVNLRTRIRDSSVANAPELSGGDLSVYQSPLYLPILAPVPLTTGYDFRAQAISDNAATKVGFQASFLVQDV